MDVSLLFPSKYIKAADFEGEKVVLTIKDVYKDNIKREPGEEVKGIVAFEETQKGWILNRTNAMCLAAMFGEETDNWIGHKVFLFSAEYDTGKMAIRVWGSPDLEESFIAAFDLPFNRVKMTMHNKVDVITKRVGPNEIKKVRPKF